jgi:hypothetical protein
MAFNLYTIGGAVAQTSTDNLAGPFQGYSARQTVKAYRDSENVMTRRVLRDSWNNRNLSPSINGHGRIVTPFRAVNSLGDYLGRKDYVCGGASENNHLSTPGNSKRALNSILSSCDNTGIAAQSGNSRFVPDSSDYIRFKKQSAVNKTYNDLSFGGDESNASQWPIKRTRI